MPDPLPAVWKCGMGIRKSDTVLLGKRDPYSVARSTADTKSECLISCIVPNRPNVHGVGSAILVSMTYQRKHEESQCLEIAAQLTRDGLLVLWFNCYKFRVKRRLELCTPSPYSPSSPHRLRAQTQIEYGQHGIGLWSTFSRPAQTALHVKTAIVRFRVEFFPSTCSSLVSYETVAQLDRAPEPLSRSQQARLATDQRLKYSVVQFSPLRPSFLMA